MPEGTFEDFPTEDEVCQGLLQMGYTGPLPRLFDFRRKFLPGVWNHLFVILLRCLSSQVTGFDKTKSSFLRVFHSFCFGRKVDYTIFFWGELKELVAAKSGRKARSYLPFLRFLQLYVANAMKTFPTIKRRPTKKAYSPPKLKFQHQVEIPNAVPMVIPLPLLEVADQSNQAVAAYREQHYPAMGPQEPRIPSPAGQPERSEERVEMSEPVRGTPEGRSSPPADSERTVSEHRGGDGDAAIAREPQRPTPRLSRFLKKKTRRYTLKIRVPRTRTSTAVCSAGPAQVVDLPPTQQPEPVHSVASQQVTVSPSHGDTAHTLPEVHSEPQGIESSRTLPQPTTFDSPRVIKPLYFDPCMDLSFDRTLPSPTSPVYGSSFPCRNSRITGYYNQ